MEGNAVGVNYKKIETNQCKEEPENFFFFFCWGEVSEEEACVRRGKKLDAF
jgi:hypothetical protein